MFEVAMPNWTAWFGSWVFVRFLHGAIRALGNAVVPQVAEFIGRRLAMRQAFEPEASPKGEKTIGSR